MTNSFWAEYKRGLLLSVLPAVLILVVYKLASTVGDFSNLLIDWAPNSKALRVSIILAAVLLTPLILGGISGTAWFKGLLEKIISKTPIRLRWMLKAVFQRRSLDNAKSAEIAIFRTFDGPEPTYKIGIVMQTFDHVGSHDFREPHCLIMEPTPPLPFGPHYIKRKRDIIIISPEFDLKDAMINTFSAGLNFPIDENNPAKS